MGNSMWLISHRGGEKLAQPHNVLRGVEWSIRLGCTHVEFDL